MATVAMPRDEADVSYACVQRFRPRPAVRPQSDALKDYWPVSYGGKCF